MSNTQSNEVTINGVDFREDVEDRTEDVRIRTPKDPTRWRVSASRSRTVTRTRLDDPEAEPVPAAEAISPNAYPFTASVDISAEEIGTNPELIAIAETIKDFLDAKARP